MHYAQQHNISDCYKLLAHYFLNALMLLQMSLIFLLTFDSEWMIDICIYVSKELGFYSALLTIAYKYRKPF